MGFITLGLGLLFFFIGLVSLVRNRIYAGGRATRSEITGKGVQIIAIPQAIAGIIAMIVGLADVLKFSAIGRYSTQAIWLLIGTYVVTNLVIGGYFQAKSSVEQIRKTKED
ncbi:MAG: hypothetical protein GY943_29220 [Chloroflexi bacterium]|nr:hypothetical protein [Chloroflexota bacterium]